MKNTGNFDPNKNSEDELLPEYNFDYTKARPNRFVISKDENSVTVTLQADVAEVFKTSEEVNKALRAILSAIPKK
ncbi:hypothetical protein [Oscillatoria salina]|uniref:hypothetical protein n=1 Tax=Oscillatoria salina TaxID=331517 RepID=UPI0013B92453|nr:hypothetical protein [Oscillatoria salina]MBZ8182923.1 hypothetical protein [Oscillatoria salina IIICB1]NET86570.1 hypothetical protein [Kamptonema sp. SIO1D9]